MSTEDEPVSTSTYVSQVNWIEDSSKNIHLTFLGNSSRKSITIDEIIDELCECQEESTNKTNNENFEALYQLIMKRLPMKCPSSNPVYLKYIQWKWLNDIEYPITIGKTEICRIQSTKINQASININNSNFNNTYFRINTILTNPKKINLGIGPEFYYRWESEVTFSGEIGNYQNALKNHVFCLVESDDDPETISSKSINNYTYTELMNGSSSVLSQSSNGKYLCSFRGYLLKNLYIKKSYLGLYFKFSSDENFNDENMNLNFVNIGSDTERMTDRHIPILEPGGENSLTFETYLESQNPAINRDYTTISNKEDYDKFSDKSE